MSEATIYILLALFFSGLLLWVARPRRNSLAIGRASIPESLESVVPRHYRFFPQIRQALSVGDEQYLREVCSPSVARQALRERRTIARNFLSGLHNDFSDLERLARMVAALSPVISREQETERLVLSLKFHILYGMVWLRLSAGPVPLNEIEHLTSLIGRLSLRMDRAISEINALSAESFSRSLNA